MTGIPSNLGVSAQQADLAIPAQQAAAAVGLDPAALPRHLAVIMDGNGRWARARGLPRIAGHRKGADAVRDLVSNCVEFGIPYLTLYSFSSENWKRPLAEVEGLMGLLRRYLQSEVDTLHKQSIRFRMIGTRERLSDDIQKLIAVAEEKTAQNRGLTLVLALSYGAREELVQAMQRLAVAVQAGTLAPEAITETMISQHLATFDIPDPDVVLRTSGEQRLSNFMLWQAAYAEFVFVDTLWPDFDKTALVAALRAYGQRDRRFGGVDG
ncbi:MAG: isoprenyl transferase [Elstera sp.]